MRLRQTKRMFLLVMMATGLCGSARAAEGGMLTGTALAKGPNWIEVRGDGAQEITRYRARWIGGLPKDGGGPDKVAVESIRRAAVPNRVRFQWITEEGPRLVTIETLHPTDRAGVVEGIITARGSSWIEVKPFGDGFAERYMPRWIGGLPKDGGGLDKAVLRAISEFKVGDKVRLEWLFDERKRVVAIRSAA